MTMQPSGYNWKTKYPAVTIVLHIRKDRVQAIRTLLDAYMTELPVDLAALFTEVNKQLPKDDDF